MRRVLERRLARMPAFRTSSSTRPELALDAARTPPSTLASSRDVERDAEHAVDRLRRRCRPRATRAPRSRKRLGDAAADAARAARHERHPALDPVQLMSVLHSSSWMVVGAERRRACAATASQSSGMPCPGSSDSTSSPSSTRWRRASRRSTGLAPESYGIDLDLRDGREPARELPVQLGERVRHDRAAAAPRRQRRPQRPPQRTLRGGRSTRRIDDGRRSRSRSASGPMASSPAATGVRAGAASSRGQPPAARAGTDPR